MSKKASVALLTLVAFLFLGFSITANAKPGDVDAPPDFDVNVVNTPDVNVVNTPNVNVANSVLTVQPAWTPSSQFFEWGTFTIETTYHTSDYPLADDVVLTGVHLQVQVAPTATDRCTVMVSLDPDGIAYYRLASSVALPGNGIAESYVPLPNVLASAGDPLTLSINPVGGDACHVVAWIYGVILD